MNRDTKEFIKAALRRPFAVSTVFPTSLALAEALLDAAQLDHAKTVIELGSGSGAITAPLLKRLKNPDGYLGVELDSQLVDVLRSFYPQRRFEAGPAENIPSWVEAGSVDAVVSSLPWSLIPNDVQDRTLAAVNSVLKPGGIFVTYLCINAMWLPFSQNFRRRLRQEFSQVRISAIELRNMPPAVVYRAQKH